MENWPDADPTFMEFSIIFLGAKAPLGPQDVKVKVKVKVKAKKVEK